MAMIDYGALVKINGKIVNEDQFFMDMEQAVGWIDYPRIRYEDCDCKIRRIGDRQFYITFRYKENFYEILYGYGIDSNKKCWDTIKHRYCDRKTIKFVDKFWRNCK